MIAELPTREVACANCNTTHSNAALCDDCAALVALPCPWDGVEGCDCKSCLVASRACGALALAESDLNVYSLPEVSQKPLGCADDTAAAPDVDIADSLPWERAYIPLTTLLDAAHALAWRAYGVPRVRLSTLDGARWQVTANDGDGAVQTDVPTYIATSPEEAVAGWTALVEELATPALERGPAPVSLAEAFPAEDLGGIVVDVDGQVTDLATGELLGSITSPAAPVAACAEVA